jgi:hypothetical protein
MTAPADIIRNESLSELQSLAGWFDLRYGTTVIVLGGWAVFSYNPYQGSFDIDCVGPREPFYTQLDLYMKTHHYELVKRDPIGLTKFFVKRVYRDDHHVGDIHIDACSFQDEIPFMENTDKRLPYGLCARSECVSRRQVDSTYVWVPTKELLFLYKLKALRDRTWRLPHEKLEASDRSYLEGKIEKDKTDLLALLDPEHGPLDPQRLRDLIEEFDLEFVLDTIQHLSDEQNAIDNYRKTRRDVEAWVDRILRQ